VYLNFLFAALICLGANLILPPPRCINGALAFSLTLARPVLKKLKTSMIEMSDENSFFILRTF